MSKTKKIDTRFEKFINLKFPAGVCLSIMAKNQLRESYWFKLWNLKEDFKEWWKDE